MSSGNPYRWRGTVTDPEAFFGREAELAQIVGLLTDVGKPQCCSLVGENRIGKSSLIYQLFQVHYHAGRLPVPLVMVYIDLQRLAPTTSPQFFQLLQERLRAELRSSIHASLAGDLPFITDWAVTGLFPLQLQFDTLWHELTIMQGLDLVFLFDELEVLINRGATTNDFFAYLRGVAEGFDVAYVVSSRAELQSLCQQHDFLASRFYNIFTPLRLGLLEDNAVDRLLTEPLAAHPIRFDAADLAQVRQLAGNHPCLLQVAASVMVDRRVAWQCPQQTLTTTQREEIERRFRQQAHSALEGLWARLSLPEQELMTRLAQGETDRLQQAPRPLVESLRERGFLHSSEKGLTFFADSFADFLRDRHTLDALVQEIQQVIQPDHRLYDYYDRHAKTLRLEPILRDFKRYVERDGHRSFWLTDHPLEETGRTMLQTFFKLLLNLIKGYDFAEPYSGAGRLDLTIIAGRVQYVLETKMWHGMKRYQEALRQLFRYMQQENVSEAWLVIFDKTQRNALLRQKGDQHVFSETDGERTIHVHFIKIRPQPPSEGG